MLQSRKGSRFYALTLVCFFLLSSVTNAKGLFSWGDALLSLPSSKHERQNSAAVNSEKPYSLGIISYFAEQKAPSSESWNKERHKKQRHQRHQSSRHKNKTFVLSPKWARTLYMLSALNPALAVVFNDYSKMLTPLQPVRRRPHGGALARTYETIFYFARLKPRVSYCIGAILRALQMTTALQFVFDPSIGVGLGLDILCLAVAQSKWPATIVLGWATTRSFWQVLGAAPPVGTPVPISISVITAGSPSPSTASASASNTK